MAFTSISKISLNQGNGGPQGIFYDEDTAAVLNQLSSNGVRANGTMLFNAVNLTGDKQFKAQVAVVMLNGAVNEMLTESHHWAAIACPPYNKPGFEANP